MSASGLGRRRKAGFVAAASICLLTIPALPTEAAVKPWCPAGVEDHIDLGRACEVSEGQFQLESDRGTGAYYHADPFTSELNAMTLAADDGTPGGEANATASAPECVTDPSEYQIVVTYAHPTTDDKYATRADQIRDLVKEANGRLDEEVGTFGGTADYRVQCDGSTITVLNKSISVSGTAATFGDVRDALKTLEPSVYSNIKFKHWIWFEGKTAGSASGTGTVWPDDDLELGNASNNAGSGCIGGCYTYAVQWGHCCGVSTTTGFLGSDTWMHEMGHNLGSVMGNPAAVDPSPNSSGTGYHCNDGKDVMCYSDGGSTSSYSDTVCGLIAGNDQYDCNNDDYFNPWPASGSYLDTHWNHAFCFNRFMSFSYCGQTLAWSSSTATLGEGSGTSTISIARTGGTDGTNSVVVTSASGTATSGADFTAISTTKSLTAGVTTTTVDVTIAQDPDTEGSETFTVALSDATGGPPGLGSTTTITITITDDDGAAGSLAFSAATTSVSEGASTVTLTVNRAGGTAGTVGASYVTTAGSASAGSDYTTTSSTVSLADGLASTTFTVPILQDDLDETGETFTVTLSTPTGGASLGAQATIEVTITDDDATPSIEFSAASASIGEGGGTVTLTVSRSGAPGNAIGATWTTAPGTATAGADYTHASTTIALGSGVTAATFDVTILQDPDVEGDETFTATLSSPTGGATLGGTTVNTVTIVEDDVLVPGTIAFSGAAMSIAESGSSAVLTLERTGGTDGVVGATYTTSAGTATTGADFTGTSTTFTIADAALSTTVSIPILDDDLDEPGETFTVTLSAPTGGATLGPTTTITVTITDDDLTPTISFATATTPSVDEADDSVEVTVTRAGAAGAAASADFSISTETPSGTPLVTDGTVSFDATETTATISVPTADDDVFASDREAIATLSDPVGAALGATSEHTVSIVEDEAEPELGFDTVALAMTELDGPVDITVTRTGAPGNVVGATVTRTGTSDGTDATVSGTVALASGELTETITLDALDDTAAEGAETVILTLSSPTGGAILGGADESMATIAASDHQPDARIASAAAGPFRGEDILNDDAVGQTLSRNSRNGIDKTFSVKIENQGPTEQVFSIMQASRGTKLRATYTVDGVNVTSAMAAGHPIVIPAGTSATMVVVLRFTKVLPEDTKRAVTIRSSFDPGGENLVDLVKLQLKYRRP